MRSARSTRTEVVNGRRASVTGRATGAHSPFVHDQDPGMLEDLPPSPGVLAPLPSPQPRKSRSRRRECSSSIGVAQRVRT